MVYCLRFTILTAITSSCKETLKMAKDPNDKWTLELPFLEQKERLPENGLNIEKIILENSTLENVVLTPYGKILDELQHMKRQISEDGYPLDSIDDDEPWLL